MNIRRINTKPESNRELLDDIQKACLPYDRPYDTNFGYWWTATDALGICTGFAGLVHSVRWSDAGYLCRSGVLPACRGQGIQKKLIRARIKKAKQLGMNWLVTDTRDNPASANSLISCGFKMFNPSVPWGFKDTVYWRLNLRK
jgi:GNAT superfamily N-acetyltransferase